MNSPITPIIPFPSTPLSEAPASAAPPAPEAASTPGARRGRPSGCSDRVIEMLRAAVRQYGLSDSAAAEKVGVSTTTLSRWKRQMPEIGHSLRQAREECRCRYLDIIERAAAADEGRGWRAAAWMLERLFPKDYSPRMRERFDCQTFEDQQRDREERALQAETIETLRAERDAQRDAWEKARAAATPASTTESDSHNSRNEDGAVASGETAPARETDSHNSRKNDEPASPEAAESSDEAVASGGDSHNCRNSVGAAAPGEVEPGGPAARHLSTFTNGSDSQNSRKAGGEALAQWGGPAAPACEGHRL